MLANQTLPANQKSFDIPKYTEHALPSPKEDVGKIIYLEKDGKLYIGVSDGVRFRFSTTPTER